ncbi:phosphoribosylformylglycinamidine synthase [Merdimmobilis hominis]|uniref:phosphoribosylformylglycinamidine synthase n=1 Tax=Merdimmobilis hominis TaxID=2897707 RepID=UPI0008F89C93|nr:phosphoribosylformylglycinamidine synthase [Merdimmobilis hominis]MCD4837060.1 phosphoribosylformylglycinamidine synthase [Merdimmobilis hominis]
MSVTRIYVEKRPEFAVEAAGALSDITSALSIDSITSLRLVNRYDVQGISQEDFDAARGTIFSEPQVDDTYDELPACNGRVFAVEYLPGQFDQRADSCAQCIQISTQKDRPVVRSAKVYLLEGEISDADFARIKAYLINPVESREASLEKPETLDTNYAIPETVETLCGFTALSEEELSQFIRQYGLAMDLDDIKCCQNYFKNEEKRDPTITEVRMIDTYWSDHCRHTTFSTHIDDVSIDCDYIKDTYREYLSLRETLYAGKDRPITLMDLATIGAKALKKQGLLTDLDQSEEINACSVKIKVDHDGVLEDWLLMFKNETHNHPTEIEPFGGAATCLGGAIRDPLSGRSYVYQAMRLTGAADPLAPVEDTIQGKLSQRKIVTTAAAGYSSYGNQIGLATGHVTELYHPGYVAKRMEVGAVIGAAPAENVVRMVPEAGDVVILLGGKTGRDGCGGATGSSKSHTVESLESCGAEVQKGNAPEERKIQRLFRNGEVTRMIKRCNDFGAGGVSVAVGELADGLSINLDAVPKKYDGLDGTELAISESQERMAVVVAAGDVDKFIAEASKENLMATPVAVVTDTGRLSMTWNGNTIVDLSREFLNSNGAVKHTTVAVPAPQFSEKAHGASLPMEEKWPKVLGHLNVCSQKGLVERFDSSVGAATVLAPFGGKHQLTPAQAMAAKIPVLTGETNTASLMAWGFNPYIGEVSPYHSAMLAVVESVAKIVAAGGSYRHCWMSFQEYFGKVKDDPARWGKPFAALLGALKAQLELGIGAIGGKDSMSGTFEDIDVPSTLISFAVSTAQVDKVVSGEFKKSGSPVYLLQPEFDKNGLPCFDSVKKVFDTVEKLISEKKVLSAYTLGIGGVAAAVSKMAFGNSIGFAFAEKQDENTLFKTSYGGFVLETAEEIDGLPLLGHTTEDFTVKVNGATVDLCKAQEVWENKLAPIFPAQLPTPKILVPTHSFAANKEFHAASKIAKPRVLIPVFPGTNSEYDTAKAFERAGGSATTFVIKNLSSQDIEESVAAFEELIHQSQIIAIPGGFSGGDEPDGSGKFITAFFRNPRIKDAVHDLLKNRDGLMLGICNGFQALVKLGLVPFGEIVDMDETCPTLTFNRIGRHQAKLVRTRIASNNSPWLMHSQVGDVYTIPISHGEGRFVASPQLLEKMAQNGQIATQYVDLCGNPTLDTRYNPNGSVDAIEGILSPDGRVLGKMAHSERFSGGTFCNVPGNYDMKLFEGAVDYYTK